MLIHGGVRGVQKIARHVRGRTQRAWRDAEVSSPNRELEEGIALRLRSATID